MRGPTQALFALGVVLTTLGCDKAHPITPASDSGSSLTLSDFSDGDWVLRIDRSYAPGNVTNTNPAQPIAEEDYQSTAPHEYPVVVSLNGQRVTIGDEPWLGERTATQSSDLLFDLTEGAFAGGRFVVRQAAQGLQAELTLYGSGVPIAQSERGALSRGSR